VQRAKWMGSFGLALWLLGGGARAAERPRVALLPTLDSARRLSPDARTRLDARLRAALERADVLSFPATPWGDEVPEGWTARARRFPELQAAGLDYAIQPFFESAEGNCELALLAFYLPTWERARYAHSTRKAVRCQASLDAALDEAVARLLPALNAPPEQAVAPPDTGPPVVAIFAMESKGDVLGPGALIEQTGRLCAGLAESGKVRVLTRDEIRARILGLSPRQGADRECFERACFLRLSKEIEVDLAVFSSLSRVGEDCMLQVQAFDVDRAISVAAAAERGACQPEDIASMVARSAPRLERALLEALPPRP
jgi:hypothetical protein